MKIQISKTRRFMSTILICHFVVIRYYLNFTADFVKGDLSKFSVNSSIAHRLTCSWIFLITCSSSMKAITRIGPLHLGQVRGSTFPDQVRDRLQFSVSIGPRFCGKLLRLFPVYARITGILDKTISHYMWRHVLAILLTLNLN